MIEDRIPAVRFIDVDLLVRRMDADHQTRMQTANDLALRLAAALDDVNAATEAREALADVLRKGGTADDETEETAGDADGVVRQALVVRSSLLCLRAIDVMVLADERTTTGRRRHRPDDDMVEMLRGIVTTDGAHVSEDAAKGDIVLFRGVRNAWILPRPATGARWSNVDRLLDRILPRVRRGLVERRSDIVQEMSGLLVEAVGRGLRVSPEDRFDFEASGSDRQGCEEQLILEYEIADPTMTPQEERRLSVDLDRLLAWADPPPLGR